MGAKATGGGSSDRKIEISDIEIGEKRWPEHPRTGAAQHDVALQQALGIANSVVSALSIGKTAYGSSTYIQSTDVEKVPQASLSCHSTANGAMITLSTRNMGRRLATVLSNPSSCAITIA